MGDLHTIFWDRIHYYGGPHNLSTAIEAELVKTYYKHVGLPYIKTRRCKWTKSETNYLLKYSKCNKQKDIALRLNRTEVAVRQKLSYIKKSNPDFFSYI